MQEFTFRNIAFWVKRNDNGELVYRDRKHFGGPWTNVEKTLACTAYDIAFRRKLKACAATVR